MTKRFVTHIVDPTSRRRADLARLMLGGGHHAEVYADLNELVDCELREGIILVSDDPVFGGPSLVAACLARAGVWLPYVILSERPSTEGAVAAVKAGALDYLALPVMQDTLFDVLERVEEEAAPYIRARRGMMVARSRIASLSTREREVLDWLARGNSNKTIARKLGISPRTVEIHRANMMEKLGASHAADAVRMKLEAGLGNIPLAYGT